MILLAMVLAAQAAPPATAADDIVVTGRRMERLKRLSMTTKLDRATGVSLQRDNQDASVATIKMRIAWGCGGAGRSPEPT